LKVLSAETTDEKSDKRSIKSSLAPVAIGGQKRILDVDEFGLTAKQRQLQMQAMFKLHQKNSKILQTKDGSVSAQAQVSVAALSPHEKFSDNLRAVGVDEFGLTASQRQIQMQAFAKFQQHSQS
jgi:hypothetical protein